MATRDMKYRIRALQAEGEDVLDVLWRRHVRAEAGEGYSYEYAEGTQPGDRVVAAAAVAGR